MEIIKNRRLGHGHFSKVKNELNDFYGMEIKGVREHRRRKLSKFQITIFSNSRIHFSTLTFYIIGRSLPCFAFSQFSGDETVTIRAP